MLKFSIRKMWLGLGLCLALLAQACSSASTAAPAQSAPPAQNESQPAQNESGGDQGAASSADLVLPDICQTLTADEVLAIAGGTLRNDATSTDYGDNFKGCTYEFTAADGSYDYYIVYVEPADFIMAGDVSGDPVEGLADFAVLRYEDTEEQYRLEVTQGSLGIEVIGSRSEVAIEIARQLLERLAP